MSHPLDNPVWQALSGRQQHFNRGNDTLKYFPQDIAPFIALENWNKDDLTALEEHAPKARSLSYITTQKIELTTSFEIVFTTPLYQMHCPELKPVDVPANIIRNLDDKDIPMMLELTAMTRPGPFYQRTIDFGNYIGIFEEGQLVAMAGDRLKANGYCEVSAICTHPDHTGKGYGSYLITQACTRIISEGDTPFLHVRSDNAGAIRLYQKMGFRIRADINFAIFR